MTKEAINLAIKESTGIDGNFFEDLNAMREAETTLESSDSHEVSVYFETLHRVVGIISDNPQWRMIHANARQRAETFLRVKNLWKE